jgi:hypothetical protein
MASIHFPPITSPISENRLQIQQGARPLPHLSVGQLLEARVLGRLDGERLLINIQDQNLVARTAIPLQAGENIRVRVEGLNPLLTLVLMEGSGGESIRTGEALQSMRANSFTSPAPENRLQIQQGARPLSHLSVGQILEARILGRLDGERLLVSIQEQSLVARTAIPLQAGENIRVKVEGMNPLLTLVLMERSSGESIRTGEALQSMRAEPLALAKSLIGLLEALDPENPGAFRTLPAKGEAGRILQLLQSLVLPKNTVENPLWIKDCLQSLGLLLESDVRKEFQKGSSTGLQERAVNLKELLLNMVETLRTQGDGEGGKGLPQKLSLFEGALRNIENLQVLNVLFQEQEGKYLLQIPFLLSGRMTTADIFVYVDQENQQRKKGSEGYRVVFALHMDALGDIMIQAKWKGKRLGCLIECGSDEIRDFIRPSLAVLAERLGALGFQTGEMTCTVKKDLGQAREEFYQRELSLTAVDLFA